MKTRHALAGAAIVVAAAVGLAPMAASARGATHRPLRVAGPVAIEVVGPDQTGFTPAKVIDAATAHALVAAVAPTQVAPAAVAAPARVAGLSFVLDVLATGSKIGLAELYGLGISAFGSLVPTANIPPQVLEQAYQVLAVPPDVFAKFAQPTADGFDQLRSAIAPLAAGNAAANMLLQAMSDALITLGTDGKAIVNPFDEQVVQVGRFLLVLQEHG